MKMLQEINHFIKKFLKRKKNKQQNMIQMDLKLLSLNNKLNHLIIIMITNLENMITIDLEEISEKTKMKELKKKQKNLKKIYKTINP